MTERKDDGGPRWVCRDCIGRDCDVFTIGLIGKEHCEVCGGLYSQPFLRFVQHSVYLEAMNRKHPMSTCPTCGQPVRVHQSSEVTGCFVPGQPDEEKIMAAFEATVPPAIQRRNEFGGYVNPAINLSWMEFRAGYLTGYSARPESEAERVLKRWGEAMRTGGPHKRIDAEADASLLARKLTGGGG